MTTNEYTTQQIATLRAIARGEYGDRRVVAGLKRRGLVTREQGRTILTEAGKHVIETRRKEDA